MPEGLIIISFKTKRLFRKNKGKIRAKNFFTHALPTVMQISVTTSQSAIDNMRLSNFTDFTDSIIFVV